MKYIQQTTKLFRFFMEELMKFKLNNLLGKYRLDFEGSIMAFMHIYLHHNFVVTDDGL